MLVFAGEEVVVGLAEVGELIERGQRMSGVAGGRIGASQSSTTRGEPLSR